MTLRSDISSEIEMEKLFSFRAAERYFGGLIKLRGQTAWTFCDARNARIFLAL